MRKNDDERNQTVFLLAYTVLHTVLLKMGEHMYYIYRASEFCDWFDNETEKARVQIDDRLSRIQDDEYFGDYKSVSDDNEVWELRWKNGRRVYFTFIPYKKILILLGGNKNGQDKDIRKAKALCQKYTQ